MKKIFTEQVLAKEPGKRDMLGIESPRVYKGNALSLKDPTTLTDEIGNPWTKTLVQAHSYSCCCRSILWK